MCKPVSSNLSHRNPFSLNPQPTSLKGCGDPPSGDHWSGSALTRPRVFPPEPCSAQALFPKALSLPLHQLPCRSESGAQPRRLVIFFTPRQMISGGLSDTYTMLTFSSQPDAGEAEVLLSDQGLPWCQFCDFYLEFCVILSFYCAGQAVTAPTISLL